MRFSACYLFALTLFWGALQPAAAQNVPFSSDKFLNKDALKAAQRALKDGEEHYTNKPPRYAAALPLFLEAQKLNPNNAALNMRLGDCYLNLGDKTLALSHLQKAAELESGPAPRMHYLLARAYHQNAKWAEAIKEYEKARPVAVGPAKKGQPAEVPVADIARGIAQSKTGQSLMQHPLRVFVDNLGPGLNSPEADHSPLISADESTLFLTSRRQGSTGGNKASDGAGFNEDIYVAIKNGADWAPARNPSTPLNSSGHDAGVALSPDGQRLLLHADNSPGDLSESRLTASGWSKPRPLGSHINTKYDETSASYSPDGKYVYFVSNKPEGSLGGRDIYRAEIEGKNPPQNLGSAINTPFDEEGVFMMPDGKTLYFSSQGHSSMGGFDIFKSVLKNGMWSAPENVGWPINSPDDEVFFVLSASGRFGYVASDRPGGQGGKDIYRITFLGPEKRPFLSQQDRLLAASPVPVKQALPVVTVPVVTPEVTVLKGVITDIGSPQTLQAQIEVIDNVTGQVVSALQSSANGKYLVSLPSGANYGIVVRHENYLYHSENVNLPPSAGYAEVVKNVRLQKMEPGSNVVLSNVFFEPGKATLRPESTAELERLVKLLNENSKLKLQLTSHTDNSGSPEANLGLSERRAQAVMAYLTDHKIKPDRLTAAGYGGTMPIAANTTEAGRQQNQRTTFKVVSK
ncbi:OmpA family protein [Hymenobacter saemangeumensis]